MALWASDVRSSAAVIGSGFDPRGRTNFTLFAHFYFGSWSLMMVQNNALLICLNFDV